MKNDEGKREKKEKEKADYEEGLKKTLTPFLFGILAGVICFVIFVSTPYLVIPDGELTEDLDNGIVPGNLINMFETNGTQLPENVTITKQGDGKWLLTDEEIEDGYIVCEGTEKLNIYRMPKSENWLLIAILLIMVQKFVYPFLHTELKGAKDWIYIAFITLFCWFLSFTLLLMIIS